MATSVKFTAPPKGSGFRKDQVHAGSKLWCARMIARGWAEDANPPPPPPPPPEPVPETEGGPASDPDPAAPAATPTAG